MPSAHKFCAVILAAGESSRMGREKALLPWPPGSATGQTMLSAAIVALQPFAQAVVVVAGKNADHLAPTVATCGAVLVLNPEPERGQFSSLQVGLRAALERGSDAVLITPVDCPPLSAETLELLSASFELALARGQWAVAPASHGRHGHPLVAGPKLIEAFLAAPATSDARQIQQAVQQHEHQQAIEYIPVPEPPTGANLIDVDPTGADLIGIDLNTPEQYAALLDASQVRS